MPSPFGLRRRLKTLLGMDPGPVAAPPAAAPRPPPVHLVLVGADGAEESCSGPPGSTLLALSGALRRPIASGCSDSTCGTCRVEVLDGVERLTPQDGRERASLSESGHPAHLRLACRAEVGEGTVRARAFERM
jgi:ferredoxin